MRILVHGASLEEQGERMRLAALGLALRGHHVVWLGRGAPEALARAGIVSVFRGHPLALGERLDLVLGGGRHPLRVAASGWCAGVHAMVLDLGEGVSRRWTLADRWGWGSLDAAGLIEPVARDDVNDVGGVPIERLVAWPDAALPAEPDATHPDVETLERLCERWSGRRHGLAARGAAFLDRDGTLVIERGYLSHADDLELFPDTAPALIRLRDAGFALVVVSNQSGVGRGFFPLSRVYEAMARLRRELRARGVELDAVYFCPHRPEAGCDCRKPGTALLRQAAANLNLALSRSAMIGDKRLDVETGHGVRAQGILVRSGYGKDEERREDPEPKRTPDFVADDLTQAAEWLVDRGAYAE